MSVIATRLSSKVEAGFSVIVGHMTRVTALRTGHDRRNAQWSMAKRRFTSAFANFNQADRAELLNLAHATLGQTYAFLLKDWNDYSVTGQSLGNAPTGTVAVQLVKTYTFGAQTVTRTINKPVASTLVMYQSGTPKAGTVNAVTGLFTPTTAWGTLPTPVNSAFSSATTGGVLAAAATYSYRVSATNAIGETLASTATSIAIAAALATPVNAAFTTAATGGTLAAATYYYRVSATNAIGETLASTETSIATTGATSTVTVNWAAVTGATGYKVYGRTTGGQLFIASVGAALTYTDTGAVTPAGALPAANTTATATNLVTVNWGAITGATGYKVYGRTAGLEQLIAAVGAVTTYNDTGSVTPAGALPTVNATATLTADFEFDVPVRFATDDIEFVLPHREIAEVNCELVEVFGE